jgi:hypothetical protein
MRAAIRNQHKLIEAFGTNFKDSLMESVRYYFEHNEDAKQYKYKDDVLPMIQIACYNNPDIVYEFYVVSKKFDFYILAYRSKIDLVKNNN